jgi:hypothetical protein
MTERAYVRDPTCRMWSSEVRSGLGLEQIRLSEVSSPLLRREVIRHNMNALPKRNPRTEAPDPVSGVKKTHPLEEITTLGVVPYCQWSKNITPKPRI